MLIGKTHRFKANHGGTNSRGITHFGLNQLPEATNLNKVDIEIKNIDACRRYSGLVVSGVEVKESPDWLKNRLKAIGLRPINNIVDITKIKNLLEYTPPYSIEDGCKKTVKWLREMAQISVKND